MRLSLLSLPAVMLIAATAAAQTQGPTPGIEFRTLAGAFVPTGAQQDDFKTATLLGVQVAREHSNHLHVLASMAWTHGHNKFVALSSERTNIWQYDAGVEFNLIKEIGNGWFVRPLVGIGAGARTYDYLAAGLPTKTCAAGYGNLGSELQRGTVALRLDARNNVNCFESPISGKKQTRNDVGLTFGVVYHIR